MQGNKKGALTIADVFDSLSRNIGAANRSDPNLGKWSSIKIDRNKSRRTERDRAEILDSIMGVDTSENSFEIFTAVRQSTQDTALFTTYRNLLPGRFDKRAFKMLQSSDCLSSDVIHQISSVFSERLVYSLDDARKVFGSYLQPLLAGQLLYGDVACAESIWALKASNQDSHQGTPMIVFPGIRLFNLIRHTSYKIYFLFNFAVSEMQSEAIAAKERGRAPSYPEIALKIAALLAEPKSSLNRALQATSFPAEELTILRSILGLEGRHGSLKRDLLPLKDFTRAELLGKLQALLKVSAPSIAIVDELGGNEKSWGLKCSPNLLKAVLDSVPRIDLSAHSGSQVFSPQAVSIALGSVDREVFLGNVYGAIMRNEVSRLQSGEISQASFKKISSVTWSSISPNKTRSLIDRLLSLYFANFRGIASTDKARTCLPSDLLRAESLRFRILDRFSLATDLVRFSEASADGKWISLIAVKPQEWGRPNITSSLSLVDQHEQPVLEVACLMGWFLGFIDIAWELDSKGIKTAIKAVRVNKAKFREVINLREEEKGTAVTIGANPTSGRTVTVNRYSTKVDVLPSGDILAAPDLHPALRFCLSTLFSPSAGNGFVIPTKLPPTGFPMDLESGEVLAFLEIISKNPIPSVITGRFSNMGSVGNNGKKLGIYTPSFVVTQATKQEAQRILEQFGEYKLFTAEISPGVWGFYHRPGFGGHDTVSMYTADWGDPRHNPTHKVISKIRKAGLKFDCSFSGLDLIASFNDQQWVSMNASPTDCSEDCDSLPELEQFLDFLEVKGTDPGWEKDEVGVNIFSLLPSEVTRSKVFSQAMSPFFAFMKTTERYL